MASRRLVPASVREALLGTPSDIASLERNYLLADEDLDLIGTRRRAENRLGLAVHIALLRHPGQGWIDDTEPPVPLVAWLAEQIDVPFSALARYGTRGATRSGHRGLATRHLGLRAFVPTDDMRTAMDLAGKHQNRWGQSSRHRRLNVQTSTSNARSPFRRKTVSPFDPTDFGTPYLWSGQQVADGQRSAGTARRFAQNAITIGH